MPNVTSLAKALHLTKGAVSKTIRKLMNKQLVESYMMDGNRQKVYYCVTSAGREIYENHEMRDNRWKQINHDFLSGLSEKEMRNAVRYLRQYNDFLKQMIEQEMS